MLLALFMFKKINLNLLLNRTLLVAETVSKFNSLKFIIYSNIFETIIINTYKTIT